MSESRIKPATPVPNRQNRQLRRSGTSESRVRPDAHTEVSESLNEAETPSRAPVTVAIG
ncbi:MAG: hypothetical protein Q4P71_06190 [Actinomycetaceae bacterium]|nr:hypothetical protein [Actinomycetaceae bacterium]